MAQNTERGLSPDGDRPGRMGRLWHRISIWLGIDRSDPVDLLTMDPARHFQEWDRDLPDRNWG